MNASVSTAILPFRRSPALWFSYWLTAYYVFALSMLGPVMPFLAARLALNFTEIGYHFTAMSFGSLVISVTGERLIRRFGRRQTLLAGALAILIALPVMLYGPALTVTLPGSSAYGIGIGLMAQVSSAMIVREAGEHTAKAYTESNIISGLALFSGPLLIGLIAASPLGWQASAFLPLTVFALLLVVYRGLPALPELPVTHDDPGIEPMPMPPQRLPRLYWVFGTMLFLVVAIEWLITSWAASFLNNVVGVAASNAALLLSVFPLAMVLGRLTGRRLLNRWGEGRVMLLSLLWVMMVFPVYWLGSAAPLNVAGLFLVGLGVGILAPLSLSGAMLAGATATDRASARLVMFPSTANLVMLQLMGVLSDRYGIQRAYTVEVLLVLVAIVVAVYAYRARAASLSAYVSRIS